MQINILRIDFEKAYQADELFVEFSISEGFAELRPIRLRLLDPFFRRPFAFVDPIELGCNSKNNRGKRIQK
jgi:hypothetical protein